MTTETNNTENETENKFSGIKLAEDTKSDDKRKEANRDERGYYLPGHKEGGRPKQTEEEKEARRIRKEALEKIKEEYKSGIVEKLPKISPALLEKAEQGDIQAIKEIHSLIFGNKTVMIGGDENDNPISVTFDKAFKKYDNPSPSTVQDSSE
jgi:hypothetical protein